MGPDPLAELLAHLERDGAVPLAWVTEHAPDGDLRGIWDSHGDAAAMLELLAYPPDRRPLALAACVCARAVLERQPQDDPRPLRAIETTEQWAHGAASLEDVSDAAEAAYAAAEWVPACGPAGHAASAAAQCAHGCLPYLARRFVEFVLRSLAPDTGDRDDASTSHRGRPAVELAMRIRARVPCPTLDQVLATARAR